MVGYFISSLFYHQLRLKTKNQLSRFFLLVENKWQQSY